MDLLAMLTDLDTLHATAKLDVRHSDRFLRRVLAWWPHVSREVRRLLCLESPPQAIVAGDASYLGTLEHVRAIARAVLEDFRMSNREGVVFHLVRNPAARVPQEDFRLSVGFTGDGRR